VLAINRPSLIAQWGEGYCADRGGSKVGKDCERVRVSSCANHLQSPRDGVELEMAATRVTLDLVSLLKSWSRDFPAHMRHHSDARRGGLVTDRDYLCTGSLTSGRSEYGPLVVYLPACPNGVPSLLGPDCYSQIPAEQKQKTWWGIL
jgi:hypothetical protein